jgi:hypothetical protein
MAKRFNEAEFVTEYTRVFKAGGTASDLAAALGVTSAIVHGRTFLLRERGFRLPSLRKARNNTLVRAAASEPTLGDGLVFDTDFLRKPLTFTITVTQESTCA